jgi:alpha-tubulin suppressor-like RCC1 family protein
MWGYNAAAQLGRGTTQASNVIPAIPNGLATANIVKVQIASGYTGMVSALEANGRLWNWGYNSLGQCGFGNAVSPITTPGLVSGFTNITDVRCVGAYSGLTGGTRDSSTCRILLANGTSFAAGFNGDGALAIGNTNNSSVFIRENSNRSNIAAIGGLTDGRNNSHYIIQNDGQMLFSGFKHLFGINSAANATQSTTFFYNGAGLSSLGFQRNMLANVGTPIVTPRTRTIASPITGNTYYGGIILDNTGNVYATGYNTQGNFGNGTTTNIVAFQQLNQYFPGTGTGRVATNVLMSGDDTVHGGTIVVLQDGTIIAAGKNSKGSVPYQITPSETVTPLWSYVPGYGNSLV